MVDFERAIGLEVRRRVEELVQEETTSAIARVRQRLGEEMDSLALRVLKHYDVSCSQDRLTITVRKPELEERP